MKVIYDLHVRVKDWYQRDMILKTIAAIADSTFIDHIVHILIETEEK